YHLSFAVVLFTCIAVQAQTSTPFLADRESHASLQAQTKTLAPQLLDQNSGIRFIENKGQIADTKGNPRPDIKYYTESVNGYQKHGSYLAEFDAYGLPGGVYLVTMQEGRYTGARELFVVK
ncbi:MAG: hypothetical protein ACREOZ_00170, partial [Gloeomargaritales cyanobacterium]